MYTIGGETCCDRSYCPMPMFALGTMSGLMHRVMNANNLNISLGINDLLYQGDSAKDK